MVHSQAQISTMSPQSTDYRRDWRQRAGRVHCPLPAYQTWAAERTVTFFGSGWAFRGGAAKSGNFNKRRLVVPVVHRWYFFYFTGLRHHGGGTRRSGGAGAY
jgi:hypothetical protein